MNGSFEFQYPWLLALLALLRSSPARGRGLKFLVGDLADGRAGRPLRGDVD